MAVDRIVQYRQKDGKNTLKVFLQPSKDFPKGSYFYCDAEDLDLIYKCGWGLFSSDGTLYYVTGRLAEQHLSFHQEVALKHLGHYCTCIDHFNHCGFDNCDSNLFNVSYKYNNLNVSKRGYIFRMANNTYQWHVCIDSHEDKVFRSVANEVEACQVRNQLEKQYLPYHYNFLEDRSNAIDILDLERTGQISHEEAVYRHVKRYSQNAWYYYRYDLADYFKEYNIPKPEYILDERGYMLAPFSNRKLCPFDKELRVLDRSIVMMEDLLNNHKETSYEDVYYYQVFCNMFDSFVAEYEATHS